MYFSFRAVTMCRLCTQSIRTEAAHHRIPIILICNRQ
jgi:hypothetical protein